jgi:tetratricopeptide (TPR) repeat protein
MSTPLDLEIYLTAPTADAPEGALARIKLAYNGMVHEQDWLFDRLTDKERENLRWYLERYWMWPYEGFKERAEHVEALLAELGQRLYGLLFPSAGAEKIVQAWRLKPNAPRQISIISELPAALSLPWELLHDDHGFLALRVKNPVSIIRRLPQRELGALSTAFTPPLRILLVTARPEKTGFIDQRVIASELLDELQAQIDEGAIELEFLRPPTLAALRARLSDANRPPIHVLHFDGHGAFAEEQPANDGLRMHTPARGALAFENDDGGLHLVEANTLAQSLHDTDVRLTVLNACQSAMGSADDVFSSVAARLIKSGVDAVAAMSTSVLVASATRYAEAFYRELAQGTAAPIAHERARQALHDDARRHIHRRRGNEEGQPVTLRDWWMPHFYQQRPLTLTPQAPRKRKKQTAALQRMSAEMPPAPRYRFSGRARELHQLERALMRQKLVVIHGFGGNGKTTLAREAADWLTRTQLYKSAIFVSFEQGGGVPLLLSALVKHLNVSGDYNPEDIAATMKLLSPTLKKQPTLIIADNLESILPGGEAPLDSTERSRLWDALHQLRQRNAGVLLTTRTLSFGDGRMAEGANVLYLPLAGLQPDDAYTLAGNILKDLTIDRKRAPYPALRDLLVQLDHHPLAIQLVLPALKEQPIERIRSEFDALLATFTDDNESGRNRSLLASLDYSLRRLSDEQRALLPRLALFEGGANEATLLEITEIPESEWATLRPALEQAALLTPERVHDAVKVPFLHFHPVLTPFLRTQPGADDPALKQRYAARYYGLVSYLYQEDDRNPQPVRAVVRRELPNLRRALALLIEMSELDAAVDLFDSMSRFLNIFGMRYERDELRKCVDVALSQQSRSSNELTRTEYLRETERGEGEYSSGHIQAAYNRFRKLLERIEAQPEGTPRGRSSYGHCQTLGNLARCLNSSGLPSRAEICLYQAITVIDILIEQQPDTQIYIRQRGILLAELGSVLEAQGKYKEAYVAYTASLKIFQQTITDERSTAAVRGRIGNLALAQQDYDEAYKQYKEALALFRSLSEPRMEAVAWHQLGRVAEEQRQWSEAEQCYRESLAIEEKIGNLQGASQTCNQLAIVARNSGRPSEAESWYKRGLDLVERVQPNSASHAIHLNNLAYLLCNEVRAERESQSRLTEARNYAEQALKVRETLDASSEIWMTLNILASIAEIEGRAEEAQAYCRRERETFAAFAGNRYHIDRQHGPLIVAIAAAQGNEQIRAAVEEALPQLEEHGWQIADATRRIWAGERDWHALCEGISRSPALLIKRVLETIENPEAAPQVEQQVPDMAAVLQNFVPLLQAIAAVAQGDETRRAEIEVALADAETKGWRLTNPVQLIWAGDRDVAALTQGLDQQDAALVQHILELIAGEAQAGA